MGIVSCTDEEVGLGWVCLLSLFYKVSAMHAWEQARPEYRRYLAEAACFLVVRDRFTNHGLDDSNMFY